jgi:hypothetical protein
MKPLGSRYSTHEEDEAVVLMATRLTELENLRGGRVARLRGDVSLTEYAKEHLEKKAVTRRASTVERDEQSLWIFAQWYQGRYGRGEPMLRDVTVTVVEEFLASRAATGSALATRMNDLHALGSLFDGAKHDGYVSGANPGRMSELPDRAKPPKPTPREAEWLEPGEGGRCAGGGCPNGRQTRAPGHPVQQGLAGHVSVDRRAFWRGDGPDPGGREPGWRLDTDPGEPVAKTEDAAVQPTSALVA